MKTYQQITLGTPRARLHWPKRAALLAQFLITRRITGFKVSDRPWLDLPTRRWFAHRLQSAAFYLEFGAGGSTRQAGLARVKTLSVEGDRYFARAVRKGLAPFHNVTILDADVGLTGPWGVPVLGSPKPSRTRRWRRFIDAPFEHIASMPGDAFPDFVMIDGRFRRACCLKTAREANRRGANCTILFDDYFTDATRGYRSVENVLGTPQRIGRAAVFEVGKQNVEAGFIDEAIRDYR